MSYVRWPPLPAFTKVIASQDVYANVAEPLTVVGSGGGGTVSPNLAVSTLIVAGGSISGGYNIGVQINTDPRNSVQSLQILFNNAGADNVNSGQLAISKAYWPDQNASTIFGLGISAFSTVYGSFQPLCCGDLYINNSDSTGNGTGSIKYVDAVSSMSLTAAGGSVSISSLNVSTVNGTSFDALVSTVIGLNGGPFDGGSPPSSAPTAPLGTSAASDTILFTFDVAGITGMAPITYGARYGTSSSGPWADAMVQAPIPPATTYTGILSGLTANTVYYAESSASNKISTLYSVASALSTTT